VLERNYFAFTNAIDPDEASPHRRGIDSPRMLHERFAVEIHAPYFYVEADINARLKIPRHKTPVRMA